MTFNLATADREVNRLFWKESGQTIIKYCLERYSKTGDKFFLTTAKAIATNHKKLNDLYIQNGAADIKDDLFELIMALKDTDEPVIEKTVATTEELFRALMEESENEVTTKIISTYKSKDLQDEPF